MTKTTLYHFTSRQHWDLISASHALNPGKEAHNYDTLVPVLWLQDTANPLDNGIGERDEVRIAVAQPHPAIRYWNVWGRLAPHSWKAVNAAGRAPVPESWYVSDEPIHASSWGPVICTSTGAELRPAATTSAPVTAWGHLPTEQEVHEIRSILRPLGDALDPLRAYLVDQQAKHVLAMLQAGERDQRIRAAWRTLTAAAAHATQ